MNDSGRFVVFTCLNPASHQIIKQSFYCFLLKTSWAIFWLDAGNPIKHSKSNMHSWVAQCTRSATAANDLQLAREEKANTKRDLKSCRKNNKYLLDSSIPGHFWCLIRHFISCFLVCDVSCTGWHLRFLFHSRQKQKHLNRKVGSFSRRL